MALTVIEFQNVDEAGQPIWPGSQSVPSLPYRIAESTRYVAFMSTVAGNLRVSEDSGAASTSYPALEVGKTYGISIRKGARPYVNFA